MKTRTNPKLTLCILATSIATALPASADAISNIAKAVETGETKLNFRYRVESVDQQGKAKNALASTLKSRLSWKSGSINNITAHIEVDNVTSLFVEDYNSTNNGKINYPVVADPEGTDVNQFNVKYSRDKLAIVAGRQRIVLGNQRFVGGVAWRQNEQTFDAARFIYKPSNTVAVDYSYVFNVNRIFGPTDGAQPADWHGNFHLANIDWKPSKKHKFTAFAYALDNDVAAKMSTNTFGIEYIGQFSGLKTTLSYASQTDAADNLNQFTADYYKAELASTFAKIDLSAGIEVLGSDNGVGFSTPLATLHKFQGFADKFLGTPADGIEDIYLSAKTKVGGVKLVATFHDFKSEKGDANYGQEIDLVAAYKFNAHVSGLLKYASYDAEDLGTDTDKVWAMVNISF